MHLALDHVQVAIPAGGEDRARAFYGGLLGLKEIPKPAALSARGGVWYAVGDHQLHLGVAADFGSARKAHPAFRAVDHDIETISRRLRNAQCKVLWDYELPSCTRFYTEDPFGNRVEILQPMTVRRSGFSGSTAHSSSSR